MARTIAFATALFVGTFAADRAAAELPPEVAVLSLHDGAEAEEAEVARNLVDAGLDVLLAEDLAIRLAAHQVADPTAAIASQFSSMTTIIASGVESFFYRSNESAIEIISPMFDLGIAHPEVLARRPDFADQIYAAGIILVRAHGNLGNDENRRAVARLLVKRFPSKEASATTVPPKVIKLLEEERANIARAGATIALHPITAPGSVCTTYLNGTPAEPDTPYVVGPEEDQYVWVDCGSQAGPLWKTRSAEGVQLEVPVLIDNPLDYRLDPADFTKRREAEQQLAALAFWTDIGTVVGVSHAPATTDDALVLVRIESGGDIEWSDGATAESVQRALVRVFPELEHAVAAPDAVARESATGAAGPDILAWSLLGGAAVAGGTGAVLLISAANANRKLACAPQGNATAAECEGIEVLEYTDNEYERNVKAVRARHAIGLGAIGVAAGLAGWGVVRLITPFEKVAVVTSGPSVAIRVQFR